MNKKNCKKIGILFILLLGIIFGDIFKINIFANSARMNWKGTDRTGAVVKGEDCPIEVEDEQLTFDLPEFPNISYENNDKFLEYKGKVTAKYTFYNPADYKVTATLVFPFGKYPDYGYYYDSSKMTDAPPNDTDKFDITVNDKKITKTLRHSLYSEDDIFDIDKDIKLLHDGFMKDNFYSPDLPVTKYVYEVRNVDEKKYSSAWAEIKIPAFDGKRKYWLENGEGFESDEDGSCKLGLWAGMRREAVLYVIGEPVTDIPKWKFYENARDEAKEIAGEMIIKSTEELSFKELALTYYEEKAGVLESDWYNAFVDVFNRHGMENESGMHTEILRPNDMLRYLMRWYEYEITINPHERITNIIEAPMYPDIDKGYEPGVYDYTYLLSPASTWAKFGKLNTDINTPFYMTENNQKGFNKTKYGYNFKSDGLPKGELKFSLSESEKPQNERNTYAWNLILVLLLTILPYIAGGVVILIIIIVLVKRCGKNKK